MFACSIGVSVTEDPIARTLGQELDNALRLTRLSNYEAAIDGGTTESKLSDMIHGRRPIHLHFVVRLGMKHPMFLWNFARPVFDLKVL